jgi:dihydrofolate reductase
MSQLRGHNISVSLDGYATGEGQAADAPFGHAGMRLHEWFFATPTWPGHHPGEEEAFTPGGLEDDVWARRSFEGFGAEIMGSGKFGPPGWQDDPDWRGWWGDEPPFHSPVVVLTHRPRPDLVVGETMFHFADTTPEDALAQATALAGGLDVRLGGGPTMIREFLATDLVDSLHLVLVPIVLGRGVSLWAGLEGLEQRFEIAATPSSSGVTHLQLTRRPR